MRKSLALLGVGAAMVLTSFVTVLAFQNVNQTPPPSDISVPQASAPEEDPANLQVAFDFQPGSAGLTDMANDGTWVFATRGRCDGGSAGTVFTSSDRGASPERREPGLRSIQAVQAESNGEITVAGAGEDCALRQMTSTDGGVTWLDEFEVTLWAVAPDDPRAVVAPSGEVTEPGCTISSLSAIDDEFARLTCIDGIVKGTGNGGTDWVDLGRLDNIRTASFTSFNTGFALARFEGCGAQVFSTRDSGRSWAPAECLPGDPSRAIVANDTSVVAVVGEDRQVFVSEDAGAEFTRP